MVAYYSLMPHTIEKGTLTGRQARGRGQEPARHAYRPLRPRSITVPAPPTSTPQARTMMLGLVGSITALTVTELIIAAL